MTLNNIAKIVAMFSLSLSLSLSCLTNMEQVSLFVLFSPSFCLCLCLSLEMRSVILLFFLFKKVCVCFNNCNGELMCNNLFSSISSQLPLSLYSSLSIYLETTEDRTIISFLNYRYVSYLTNRTNI
mmetsp:Transcript_155/g.173  ORF Transcript_155/g.173 Transcript_155/m.173 type:complete len:126 (-) Transcript_155:136-513(-)